MKAASLDRNLFMEKATDAGDVGMDDGGSLDPWNHEMGSVEALTQWHTYTGLPTHIPYQY